MVYKVVSTKLTEEEHSKLIDFCNRQGYTPSSLIKKVIIERINSEQELELQDLTPHGKEESILETVKKLSDDELRKLLGLRQK